MVKRKRTDRHSHANNEPSPKNARTLSGSSVRSPSLGDKIGKQTPGLGGAASDARPGEQRKERWKKLKDKKHRKGQAQNSATRCQSPPVDARPKSIDTQRTVDTPSISNENEGKVTANGKSGQVHSQLSPSQAPAASTASSSSGAKQRHVIEADYPEKVERTDQVRKRKQRRHERSAKREEGGKRPPIAEEAHVSPLPFSVGSLQATPQAEEATDPTSSPKHQVKHHKGRRSGKSKETTKTKPIAQQQKPANDNRKGSRHDKAIPTGSQKHDVASQVRNYTTKVIESPGSNHVWTVSDPRGGRMQHLDPLFSPDEQFLLIAYQTFVAVYATSTSLLVHKLPVREGQKVVAMAFSCPDSEDIIIGASDGGIRTYDWKTGKLLKQWNTERRLRLLTSGKVHNGKNVVLTIHASDRSKWQLYAHVRQASNVEDSWTHTLFDHDRPISSLFTMHDGATIIMTSGDQLILGSRVHFESLPQKLYYSWQIFTCPEWIQSIDVHEHRRASDGVHRNQSDQALDLDIAIGGLKGSIYIYNDVVNRLKKKQTAIREVQSRHLHWHRNAVNSLKWSQDGNYLISGGEETVLVMWQLDTGRKEVLPHLGAPIESIVVSPSGSAYGICLADNSAMILSTAEMRPFFSMAGIQLPAAPEKKPSSLLTADRLEKSSDRYEKEICTATVSRARPGEILLAVPSHSLSHSTSLCAHNRSYLQTIDVESSQQTSRQALVRTNITNKNIAPGGFTIQEPNVTHLSTSHSGEWLATCEEWIPPKSDRMDRAFSADGEEYQQDIHREHYLKFWSRDDAKGMWQLNSRIDKPHAHEADQRPAKIMALITDPSKNSFATFGEDGFLKIWKPSIRRRNGLEVKDDTGKNYSNWHQRSALKIAQPQMSSRHDVHIAWSQDGSVIVLGGEEKASPIYLIDAMEAKVEKTHIGIYSDSLLTLGIVDRYLVILAEKLILWDLVSETPHWSTSVDISRASAQHLNSCMLAISAGKESFAISWPNVPSGRSEGAKITIYGLTDEKPLFKKHFHRNIAALLPAADQNGYYAIDSAAEVRTITPGRPFHVALEQSSARYEDPPKGLSSILGEGTLQKRIDFTKEPDPDLEIPRVSREQLAEAVNPNPGQALPSVDDMFQRVVDLYLPRRPKVSD